MITEPPKPGDSYRYEEKVNPAIISASSMPPTEYIVHVTAVDEQDVWYRLDNKSQTKQTSIERFMSIVKPVSIVTA